jgi:hypothetical protein
MAALAATVLWAPPRAAAVDITGTWAVTASCAFTPGLAGTLVSAGDAFTLDFTPVLGFPCVITGTVDSVTGAMSGSGCVFGGFPATLTATATDTCLSGTIVPPLDNCAFQGVRACGACDDGNPCTTDGCGSGDCPGSPTCAHVPVPAATACDDGTVCTTDDTCDVTTCEGSSIGCEDGNTCTSNPCDPVLGCQTIPDTGAPCTDGNQCTVGDACTAAGTCAGGPPLACAACERCTPAGGCQTGPRAGCLVSLVPERSVLLVKNRDPDTRDKLVWKWRSGALTSAADFGDPVTTDDYTLCLFEDAASTTPGLLASVTAPAGGTCPFGPSGVPCWTAPGTPPGSRGFRYRDGGLLLPDGVAKVRLVPGGDTKAKVVVAGKGGNLALPSPLDVTLPVTVQLQRASGECWETHHPTASINREDLLKAAGAP